MDKITTRQEEYQAVYLNTAKSNNIEIPFSDYKNPQEEQLNELNQMIASIKISIDQIAADQVLFK